MIQNVLFNAQIFKPRRHGRNGAKNDFDAGGISVRHRARIATKAAAYPSCFFYLVGEVVIVLAGFDIGRHGIIARKPLQSCQQLVCGGEVARERGQLQLGGQPLLLYTLSIQISEGGSLNAALYGAPVRLKSARTAETRIVLLLLNYKWDPATMRMAGEIIGARDIDFSDPSDPTDRVDRDIYAGDTVEPLHILYDVTKQAPVAGPGGGIAFVADNPSRALHKISEIYDRIAFAAVGRYNEFENLRIAGVRLAEAADLVLLVTTTGPIDLERMLETIRQINKPSSVLLTQTRYGTRSLRHAEEFLAENGLAHCRETIPYKEAMRLAPDEGRFPSASGYGLIAKELSDAFNA